MNAPDTGNAPIKLEKVSYEKNRSGRYIFRGILTENVDPKAKFLQGDTSAAKSVDPEWKIFHGDTKLNQNGDVRISRKQIFPWGYLKELQKRKKALRPERSTTVKPPKGKFSQKVLLFIGQGVILNKKIRCY